ncbi:LITAF-like zinc ribbon domain-containing protein [Fennellomyces sp. T-0311]|nr:LITAF-like zinc ribbon domain-containing protein [Fennellomyces sp. T-0311]
MPSSSFFYSKPAAPTYTEQPPPPPYNDVCPPPPPNYPPPPEPPHTCPAPPSYGTVIPTINHNYTALASLRADPGVVQCPECGHQVETVTDYKNGSAVVFSALLLLVFGCHGSCLIPFCCPLCKDVQHTCPVCHATIATYSRLSQNVMLGES